MTVYAKKVNTGHNKCSIHALKHYGVPAKPT